MKKIFFFIAIISVFLFQFVFGYVNPGFKLDFKEINSIGKKIVEAIFLVEKHSMTHYSNNNYIGGSLFILGKRSLSIPETVSVNGKIKSCNQKLLGYYYVSTRGSTMYSLDDLSISEDVDYSIKGGLYTNCVGSDLNTIYGQIIYNNGTNNEFVLTAGVKLNVNNNKLSDTNQDFIDSFQYYNSVTPIGLIHDSHWGIGFVGGEVMQYYNANPMKGVEILVNHTNNGKKMNELIESITDTEIIIKNHKKENAFINNPLYIRGKTGIVVKSMLGLDGTYNIGSKSTKMDEEEYQKAIRELGNYKGSTLSQKAYIAGGNQISISGVINTVRKTSQDLCRGKWEKFLSDQVLLQNRKGKLNCIDTDGNDLKFTINSDFSNGTKSTTFIIKGGQNVLNIKKSQTGKYGLNVFLNSGILSIENSIDKVSINGEGKYDINNEVTKGVLLRGLYYINGILAVEENGILKEMYNKVYINGLLASYNSIEKPSDSRIKYIMDYLIGKITTQSQYINLGNTFKWRCDISSGEGQDGAKCNNPNDSRKEYSIIITNEQFENIFLNN